MPCAGSHGTDRTGSEPRPLNIAAVAEFANILIDVMPDHATAAQISPTWDVEILVTWERGDICLETAPDCPAPYSYVDERDGNDSGDEGDVAGNEDNLKRWLPTSRTHSPH